LSHASDLRSRNETTNPLKLVSSQVKSLWMSFKWISYFIPITKCHLGWSVRPLVACVIRCVSAGSPGRVASCYRDRYQAWCLALGLGCPCLAKHTTHSCQVARPRRHRTSRRRWVHWRNTGHIRQLTGYTSAPLRTYLVLLDRERQAFRAGYPSPGKLM
jgi:hypothetical protein